MLYQEKSVVCVISKNSTMLAELVGSVEEDHFEIEDALEKQLGARPMPFPGMDSTYPVLWATRMYSRFMYPTQCVAV